MGDGRWEMGDEKINDELLAYSHLAYSFLSSPFSPFYPSAISAISAVNPFKCS